MSQPIVTKTRKPTQMMLKSQRDMDRNDDQVVDSNNSPLVGVLVQLAW